MINMMMNMNRKKKTVAMIGFPQSVIYAHKQRGPAVSNSGNARQEQAKHKSKKEEASTLQPTQHPRERRRTKEIASAGRNL